MESLFLRINVKNRNFSKWISLSRDISKNRNYHFRKQELPFPKTGTINRLTYLDTIQTPVTSMKVRGHRDLLWSVEPQFPHLYTLAGWPSAVSTRFLFLFLVGLPLRLYKDGAFRNTPASSSSSTLLSCTNALIVGGIMSGFVYVLVILQ